MPLSELDILGQIVGGLFCLCSIKAFSGLAFSIHSSIHPKMPQVFSFTLKGLLALLLCVYMSVSCARLPFLLFSPVTISPHILPPPPNSLWPWKVLQMWVGRPCVVGVACVCARACQCVYVGRPWDLSLCQTRKLASCRPLLVSRSLTHTCMNAIVYTTVKESQHSGLNWAQIWMQTSC